MCRERAISVGAVYTPGFGLFLGHGVEWLLVGCRRRWMSLGA
jgi:hypothetical protein